MRLLLIEDDEGLVELLTKTLAEQRYVVDVALDGETGWELAQVYPYNLIVLDVNLPQLDGITLCRKLRECNDQTLVMMLTARDSITDRILGLNSGADDYVVKPFDIYELAARIRALIRRQTSSTPTQLTCGQLALNPNTREVTFAQQPFPVSRKEYLLIELFLRHQKRVFSRNDIIDHLWSVEEDPPTQETVKSHIKSLRNKLKKVNASDWIETLYGQGYRVNPKYLQDTLEAESFDPVHSQQLFAGLVSSEFKTQLRAIATQVWQRTENMTLKRIAVLEDAIDSLEIGTWDDTLRSRSIQEVHKLAGTLGSFGLARGSTIAYQIEALLKSETKTIPRTTSLKCLVEELQHVVRSAHPQSDSEDDPSKFAQSSTMANMDLNSNLIWVADLQDIMQTFDWQARILQVDDDSQMLSLGHAVLSFLGFHITTLEGASQFWATLQTVRPDLLILDVEMSEVSGLDLCQAIRQHAHWHWLPIIMLTVQADSITEQRAFLVGVDDFVLKPILPEELLLRVINRLQRSRSRQRSSDIFL